MPELFSVLNGARPTTAAAVAISTGATIKTMIQIATTATRPIYVSSWHISFNGAALATPITVELLHTDVYAVGTGYAAGDITNELGTGTTPTPTLGNSASMYNSTVEGVIADTHVFETLYLEPIGLGAYIQYPDGQEKYVPVSRYLRLRVTAPVSVSCYCGIKFRD